MNKIAVVVTGVGLVTALGNDAAATWDGLAAGKNGVQKIERFDTSLVETTFAGQVDDSYEDALHNMFKQRKRKKMSRVTKMALTAVQEAVEQAGLDFSRLERRRIGVIGGVINGGLDDALEPYHNESIILKSMPNSACAWTSIHYGLHGPAFSVSTACASAAYALYLANMFIQADLADIMIVLGSDSEIDPVNIKGFNQLMAMSLRNDSPQTASRPFSLSRDGFVMGEGAGALILEREDIARRYHHPVLAHYLGGAITSEAGDITAPAEGGREMAHTMRQALAAANLSPQDIDYINAHGTSTYLNDKYETMAIEEVFGEHAKNLAVSSSKSMLGHTLGAAGIIEAIVAILSLKHQLIPPTINYHDPDPELNLNYVPNQALAQPLAIVMSNSFGFGGHNSSLIFAKAAL